MKYVLLSIFLVAAVTTAQIVGTQQPVQWTMAGADLRNTRSQPTEHQVGRENVFSLTTKWVFKTDGDISATPAVGANAVYVPDWAGNLFAVRKDTGQMIWSHKIADYDGFKGAIARVTPAIHGTDLIIGDIESESDVHNGRESHGCRHGH